MSIKLKQASCDHTCGFLIRSPDVDEIKHFFKLHFKNTHKMELKDSAIVQKIITVKNTEN